MTIEGTVLPIPRANIDTDQIIPAHYLTRIDADGMGEHLFEGMPDGADLLGRHPGASIIVTGENFGCGSSREHAAWALLGRGFRAVIAPSFARIFHENAYNNGVVPVILSQEIVDTLMRARTIAIDVAGETLRADGGEPIAFALDPLRKQFVLGGGFLNYLHAKIPTVRAWEAAR
jgi:3-isopropylmalate/(R)-2-methylmalate dehydratase small subunit